MKNLFKLTIVVFMLVFSTQACNDILEDPQPSTSLSQEVSLQDPGAIRAIRASMYSRLHNFTYTTRLFLGPETLADNLTNRDGSTRFIGLANNNTRVGMAPTAAYDDTYELINDANILISGLDENALDNPDEQAQFRGEALALRAFAMHNLVRALGFEPGATPNVGDGSGFTLGIPIRLEPSLTLDIAEQELPRAEVSAVYTQIKNDLTEAISILGNVGTTNRVFMTQAGAQAIKARVHLYERDYPAAATEASNARANTEAGLATADIVPSMFNEQALAIHPEAIFLGVLTNPGNEGQGVNDALNAYTETQWVAQVPTVGLRDLYDPDDVRNDWFGICDDQDGPVTGCPTGEELRKWGGELGSFADNLPFFRVAEMVLIQAEAELNTSGVNDAIGTLNTLRTNRGLDALDPANFNEAQALNEILDERRREFIGEGHRFFDLKRLQRTITKDPATGRPDVSFSDRRVLDDVPEGLIQDNPALEQNPGYN